MKYVIFVLTALPQILMASAQLIIVVSDEFNATTATLQRYELHNNHFKPVGTTIPVNLGRSGMGWSLSELNIPHNHNDPLKREGDGRAAAGIFYVTGSFGYAPQTNPHMPHIQSSRDLICVDDVNSSAYNTITTRSKAADAASFELMRRDDGLYELGLTLSHNSTRTPYHGSCIFLHVEKAPATPTAGCTSMTKEQLRILIEWLDIRKKPLLIQIPKQYLRAVMQQLEQLKTL